MRPEWVRRRLRVPVLGSNDQCPGILSRSNLSIDERDGFIAAGDIERSVGVGEIVLHIDENQRRLCCVLHVSRLLG